MFSCRWRRFLPLVFLLTLGPRHAWGQTLPINSNLVVYGTYNYCAPATASGTTYACALGVSPSVYWPGARYAFKADVANTGAATINFSSLGAKSIVKVQWGITTALVANDIRAGQMVELVYDGTNMQMVSPLGNAAIVASGTLTLSTSAIASGACTAAQTATATGTLSTDVVVASFNGDPTAVTGYIPSTNGMLTIISYATTNTFNSKVCNNTAASITPGAITLNWRVLR